MLKQVIHAVKRDMFLRTDLTSVSISLIRYQSRCNMETINEEDLIRDLNMSYLWLAQRLLRTDRATGMFRLGTTPEMAGALEGLSMRSMLNLASSGQLICVLRLSRCGTVEALARHGPPDEVAPLHVALAFSSIGAFEQDTP
ncbi:flagellar transcriptional regulator FlhD [Burkholderia sp. BCC1644]|uniref:flagellar transcriptional regulator FlhD n=1 Tax=Burkholderia sp. BCC1644 TaxID=2676293 RepID=UPI001FC8D9F5|nr:flagellar transcriptional regulator FlhD [Burkholderia sp. BCC1644]